MDKIVKLLMCKSLADMMIHVSLARDGSTELLKDPDYGAKHKLNEVQRIGNPQRDLICQGQGDQFWHYLTKDQDHSSHQNDLYGDGIGEVPAICPRKADCQ